VENALHVNHKPRWSRISGPPLVVRSLDIIRHVVSQLRTVAASQIGQFQWILRDVGDEVLLTVDYAEFHASVLDIHAVRDVLDFHKMGYGQLESQSRFLAQFDTVSSRWGGMYEQMTEETLTKAAVYQAQLLAEERDSTLTDEEQSVILSALRCLVITRNVEEICGYLPYSRSITACPHVDELITKARLESHLGHWCAHPSTYLSNSFVHKSPSTETYATLASLLPMTLNAAQSMLLRGRPKDWPTLFYVLYVLVLLQSDLDSWRNHSASFEAVRRATDKALTSLSILFLFCCGNSESQPFSKRFDKTRFAFELGVGTDHMYVEHYDRHHRLWMEEGQ
jgi:hypothetical protein